MGKSVRILLVSDLHAIDDPKALRSSVAINYAQMGAPRALFNQCLTTVRERFPEGLDLMVVAGDMTDRAGGIALSKVWGDLHWLAEQLCIPLVATSGNHDYDSRATQSVSPKQSLMGLNPPFPFGTTADRDHYFAQEHAVFVNDELVVVTANSSAFHGYIPKGQKESEHGRFADYLPEYIKTSLDSLDSLAPYKILLTHHHLNQLPSFDTEETSSSRGHEQVLRALADYGDWLIIHGHKHRGWLQYASGYGDAPPLISSSSFSADLGTSSFADKVRHQFHVVELEPSSKAAPGLGGQFGSVYSWTHSPIGWTEAIASDDLPGVSGFGWKANIHQFAASVRIEVSKKLLMDEADLEKFEPRLKYLTFDDRRRLINYLRTGSPKVEVSTHTNGSIREFALTKATV